MYQLIPNQFHTDKAETQVESLPGKSDWRARRDSKVAKPTATYMWFRFVLIMIQSLRNEELSPKSFI